MFLLNNYLVILLKLLKNYLNTVSIVSPYHDYSYLFDKYDLEYPTFLLSEFLVERDYVFVQIDGEWYNTSTVEFYSKLRELSNRGQIPIYKPADLKENLIFCASLIVWLAVYLSGEYFGAQ